MSRRVFLVLAAGAVAALAYYAVRVAARQVLRLASLPPHPDGCPVDLCDGWGLLPDGNECRCVDPQVTPPPGLLVAIQDEIARLQALADRRA